MLTRVVHCKRKPYTVYCGRPSKWGNWYTHEPAVKHKHPDLILVATRDEAVERFEEDLVLDRPDLLGDLDELRGEVLGCWCHPKRCHCDVLAYLADL